MYKRRKSAKEWAQDIFFGTVAVLVGALIVLAGDHLLGVSLEKYYGILETFSPIWIVDLIVVPFIAGIVVSAIYGLGGKILSYFAPLLVRLPMYFGGAEALYPNDGGMLLQPGFWILILIVSVEAAGGGGIVGEIIIKKTYGRRPKDQVYKRYQIKTPDPVPAATSNISSDGRSN